MIRNAWGGLALLIAASMAAPCAAAAPREVNLHFRGLVERGVPLDFGPVAPAMRVKVGEKRTVMYRFTNLSNQPMRLSAVPSVLPTEAVSALKVQRLESQTLGARESKLVLVEFRVDGQLPGSVAELTLGYQVKKDRGAK